MKKDDKEIEKILLNDRNYDKFIRTKTEKEFNNLVESQKQVSNTFIQDINKVPSEKLFCKNATYIVICKTSKTKSYINGIQAESFLVSNTDREKLLKKEIDSFVYGDYFVKFYKLKV